MGKKLANSVEVHQPPGVRDQAPAYAAGPASLADALFTQTQQRVLGLLFGQPERSFTVSDVIAATGGGSGAVQRELRKLLDSGLVTLRPLGNQKHYQANPAAPIHAELVGIIRKTVGLAEPLREALAPLANRIAAAFVYGSIARRSDTAGSDIDLMVVGDASFAEVVNAVHLLHERLGREVNPVVMTAREFRTRAKDPGFIARMMDGPRIPLFGEADDA